MLYSDIVLSVLLATKPHLRKELLSISQKCINGPRHGTNLLLMPAYLLKYMQKKCQHVCVLPLLVKLVGEKKQEVSWCIVSSPGCFINCCCFLRPTSLKFDTFSKQTVCAKQLICIMYSFI